MRRTGTLNCHKRPLHEETNEGWHILRDIRSDVPAFILTLSFCEALQNAVIARH